MKRLSSKTCGRSSESSRWVFFPDGTFEVRAYKGHILSARLMGTYSSGLSPWTITGNGRSQDNRPVPDGQRVSATIHYAHANEIVLQVSFDCTFGDASLGAARMAGSGWGTTWAIHFSSRFDLPLERGIHRPNQGNALVLASHPIPLENPAHAPQAPPSDDPLMDQARRTIAGADQLLANGKAKQAFDQGFWEFYPDGTFRYTHDPLRFFPMHEL
ncbi:MAG: hypothetical protein IPM54_12280 [Polyangiaceae bacterium]|nr:hypothetical protein [Polyangiaceae bacterium]